MKIRVLWCRRCGGSAGTPGAVYCDACRPQRLSDALMTDADRAREAELAAGAEPVAPART